MGKHCERRREAGSAGNLCSGAGLGGGWKWRFGDLISGLESDTNSLDGFKLFI